MQSCWGPGSQESEASCQEIYAAPFGVSEACLFHLGERIIVRAGKRIILGAGKIGDRLSLELVSVWFRLVLYSTVACVVNAIELLTDL